MTYNGYKAAIRQGTELVYISYSPAQSKHYFTTSKLNAQTFISKQECLIAFNEILIRTSKTVDPMLMYPFKNFVIIKMLVTPRIEERDYGNEETYGTDR